MHSNLNILKVSSNVREKFYRSIRPVVVCSADRMDRQTEGAAGSCDHLYSTEVLLCSGVSLVSR